MKYECPHCHEKTFTPLQKALCGSYRTMGKPCPKCGRRACNGMTGIYFQSVTSIAMIIAIITIYLKATERVHSSMLIGAIILGMLDNVLGLKGINSNLQLVVKGFLIIIAVFLQADKVKN